MNKGKKIMSGIIISVVGFFAIRTSSMIIWQTSYPEDYAKWSKEVEERDHQVLLDSDEF